MPRRKEYPVTSPPKMPPTHPGALLREDVLPALKVSISQAARDLGISRQTLHDILAERMSISPEMALRLGKYCGNGPELWLHMQTAHDLWRTEAKVGRIIARIRTRRAAA